MTALPPEIQAGLDEIKAERAAKDAEAQKAADAEEQRIATLDAAKKECADACGPIGELIATSEDEEERAALVAFQEKTHEGHAQALEAAYAAFAGPGESNPAEGVTQITATSSATGGVSA